MSRNPRKSQMESPFGTYAVKWGLLMVDACRETYWGQNANLRSQAGQNKLEKVAGCGILSTNGLEICIFIGAIRFQLEEIARVLINFRVLTVGVFISTLQTFRNPHDRRTCPVEFCSVL